MCHCGRAQPLSHGAVTTGISTLLGHTTVAESLLRRHRLRRAGIHGETPCVPKKKQMWHHAQPRCTGIGRLSHALTSRCRMPSEAATRTLFKVFGMTWPGFDPEPPHCEAGDLTIVGHRASKYSLLL